MPWIELAVRSRSFVSAGQRCVQQQVFLPPVRATRALRMETVRKAIRMLMVFKVLKSNGAEYLMFSNESLYFIPLCNTSDQL